MVLSTFPVYVGISYISTYLWLECYKTHKNEDSGEEPHLSSSQTLQMMI